MTVVKEFGIIILSIISLLGLAFVLFFIRWIKRLVQNRVDTPEKDVDNFIHELV